MLTEDVPLVIILLHEMRSWAEPLIRSHARGVPEAGAVEEGLGVIGRHPDGVGDLLGLGVQPDHVRGQVAEPDPGGGSRGGSLGRFQLVIGGPDGALSSLNCWFVTSAEWPGAGLRRASRLASCWLRPR